MRLFTPIFFFLCVSATLRENSHAAEQPNIIVIMVDDMGVSDIAPYGGEIPTPNLDALASGGVKFSQFHNTGRCCPTRASLLTGLYSHQAGIGHMTRDSGVAGYRGRLSENCVTIAEVLKSAGYFTAMTGKWHVGFDDEVNPPKRGFDRSLNLAMGFVKKEWPLTQRPEKVPAWDSLSDDQKKRYDLARDRTEQNDLAKQRGWKVEELKLLWIEWADTHQVRPYPGAKKKKGKK